MESPNGIGSPRGLDSPKSQWSARGIGSPTGLGSPRRRSSPSGLDSRTHDAETGPLDINTQTRPEGHSVNVPSAHITTTPPPRRSPSSGSAAVGPLDIRERPPGRGGGISGVEDGTDQPRMEDKAGNIVGHDQHGSSSTVLGKRTTEEVENREDAEGRVVKAVIYCCSSPVFHAVPGIAKKDADAICVVPSVFGGCVQDRGLKTLGSGTWVQRVSPRPSISSVRPMRCKAFTSTWLRSRVSPAESDRTGVL